MTRRYAAGFALASYFGLALTACGDVRSDLITGASSGNAGSPGGASTAGANGSGTGGASTGGASTGGASTGGAGAGGASAGSSSGGASGGSGGTPECTPETADMDCTSPDRNLCRSDGKCVECVIEAHCDADENCSADLGECAEPCTDTSQCTDDEDRFCDTFIGFCVECLTDTDCPSGVCSNWSCD